jgi:hypothetical protein
MSFIEIANKQVTPEFREMVDRVEPLHHRHEGLKFEGESVRLQIIGEMKSYQQQYPQRSDEHTLISTYLDAKGWSPSTVSRCFTAYKEQQRLLDNGNQIFEELGRQATERQLYELATAKDHSIAVDAAKHLQRKGTVPAVSKLKGYKGGFFDGKFESRPGRIASAPSVPTPPPITAPTTPYVYQPEASKEIPSVADAITTTASSVGNPVIDTDPTPVPTVSPVGMDSLVDDSAHRSPQEYAALKFIDSLEEFLAAVPNYQENKAVCEILNSKIFDINRLRSASSSNLWCR